MLKATELKVFLADIATRITDASKAESASSGGATAAWFDFLSGWLSRSDSDLVEPDSMQMVAQASSSTTSPAPAGVSSTPPRATPSTTGSQRSPKASPSGSAGGGGPAGPAEPRVAVAAAEAEQAAVRPRAGSPSG